MSENLTVTVSEATIQHLDDLWPEDHDLDSKIQRLVEAEYRRKLSRYNLTARQLGQKYGMSFEEFELQDVEKQHEFSWEVESDAIAWETAIDGQKSVERKLRELLPLPHNAH